MFHKIFFFSPLFNFFLFALWETPVDAFHMQHEIRFFFLSFFFLRNYTACQLCIRAICHLHIRSHGCVSSNWFSRTYISESVAMGVRRAVSAGHYS